MPESAESCSTNSFYMDLTVFYTGLASQNHMLLNYKIWIQGKSEIHAT